MYVIKNYTAKKKKGRKDRKCQKCKYTKFGNLFKSRELITILISDKLKIHELYVKEIQLLASSNKTKL